MRRASLTRQLLLLIAAITIPLTLLSSGILYLQYRTNRAKAERDLVQHARTIALLVDREFEAAQAVARALAGSTALQRSDFVAFRQELVEASRTYSEGLPAGTQPVMMGLVGLDGVWIVDTGPLGNTVHEAPEHTRKAIESGRPQVSDLYIGSVTGQPRVSVSVPAFSAPLAGNGPRRTVGAIGVALSRQRFLDIVAATQLPQGAIASIQDRRGVIVARSFRDAETLGKLPTPTVLAMIMKGDAGLAPPGTATLEGIPSTIAFAHAPHSRFIVKFDVPESVFLAPLRASLLHTAEVGAAVLAVGLGLALLLARQMVLALRRVVPAAQGAAADGAMPAGLGLRDADNLAGELTRLLIGQRAAAVALTESESRFRTLADVMPQLVWAARPDGYCDYFNARCSAFTGTPAGTLDGQIWNNLLHPDDRAVLNAAWERALATGKPFEVECRRRRYDGAYRWMLVRAVPMRGEPDADHPEGPIIRWFGSSTDITDIMEAREVSARGRAELEALIEQRTRDLRDVQARLAHAARMDALGQLAGGIAHDFNNVLQAILSGSALIEHKPEDPATVTRLARMVFESAERGAAITQRLIAFSRRSTLRTEVIDLAAMLRDIQEILSHTMGAGIRTEITIQHGLPKLLADKGQLETVLVNFATNARDAMAGNGVISITATVDVITDPDRPHPAALPSGSYVCLSVSDTGIGMDAATLERVVEPFFTTKQPGHGTGLGLAMAHGFAGQSGGGLHIESTPGKGTTVRLWLPIAGAAATNKPSRNGALASPGQIGTRLLLVDDEVLIRDLVGGALEVEGFEVLVAGSAKEALSILDGAAVDLLISDMSMPGMDGVALIKEAQRRRPGLPAILLTGFAKDETEIAVNGAFSGSFSLLRKPVTAKQLANRVMELIQASAGSN